MARYSTRLMSLFPLKSPFRISRILPVAGIAPGLGVAGDAFARNYTANAIDSLMALHYGYIVDVEDDDMLTTRPTSADDLPDARDEEQAKFAERKVRVFCH